MGGVLGQVFIDPAIHEGGIPDTAGGFVQVLFLGGCYGYLLLQGSSMISEGSELLLLIPEMAGVVGSVVLPVLGAVPDGAIVLFSGLGPLDQVEQQLSVGVGALAGSTVMLLTVPWFLAILGGRVPFVRGEPCYSRRQRVAMSGREVAGAGLFDSGVSCESSIRTSAIVMTITALLGYFIVEIPALALMDEKAGTAAEDLTPFAWTGLVFCVVMFFGYLALQVRMASQPAGVEEPANITSEMIRSLSNQVASKAISQKEVSLRAVLSFYIQDVSSATTAAQPLAGPDMQVALRAKVRAVVRPFFARFDADRSGHLSKEELSQMTSALGERVKYSELDALFENIDADQSGTIDYEECVTWLTGFVMASPPTSMSALPSAPTVELEAEEGGDDEDEEPEVPEDFRDLPPVEQRRRVIRRSCWQMGCGTLLVPLLSDPMVDVLDTLGARTGIPAFYVAFLLAPLASNASEMVASYAYAQKKSQKSISISFAQLLGAACMNNTFCLGIFYLLVAARGLGWTYHAEVCGVIFVQLVVAAMAMRKVHTLVHGAFVLALLPVSLLMIFVLKATVFKGKEQ